MEKQIDPVRNLKEHDRIQKAAEISNGANKIVVGIDASRSNVAQRTGTEYYSFEIIRQMCKSKDFRFRLYSKTPIDYLKDDVYRDIENKVMKFPRLWSQIRLSYEIMRHPPDVTFFPAHTIPIYHGKKTVVTLHDVGFRYYPELYTPLERNYHNFSMAFSVRHATKIIAISEATKKDLISFYKADEKRIEVIYHGYDKEKYFPLKTGQAIPDDIKKLQPYIYFISRLEAKKNVKNLIKAFGKLKTNKNIKHKLVLAGRPGYMYDEIKKEVELLPQDIKGDVVELGYVPDDKVADLMRNAGIFAFPSNFEGFGMPLVEAMACGVPIVASNTTSIPEIVKDAAILCDPASYVKIADALEKTILDKSLAKGLIERGLKRAQVFNWEDAAQKTLRVISAAASS